MIILVNMENLGALDWWKRI